MVIGYGKTRYDWGMKYTRFMLASLVLVLSGCGIIPAPNPLGAEDKPMQSDPALVDTAEAATSISHALSELATASRQDQGLVKRETDDIIPQTLTRVMSIDWAGPVEPLVKQLAQSNHLRFKVIGKEPAIPVLVSMRKREVVAYDVLQDIQAQIAPRAEIVVFPTSGVIELHYM